MDAHRETCVNEHDLPSELWGEPGPARTPCPVCGTAGRIHFVAGAVTMTSSGAGGSGVVSGPIEVGVAMPIAEPGSMSTVLADWHVAVLVDRAGDSVAGRSFIVRAFDENSGRVLFTDLVPAGHEDEIVLELTLKIRELFDEP